ncbi:MAG: hypothetical protein OEW60_07940, partial [Thiovulaceae bacterium]|nr:hypothetical protein [Sulfurimonadaceae bacterium]
RDLYDVIENAAYEELGLDITLEYKIDYFEQDHHDSNHRVFEVFIAEPEIIFETFSEIIAATHYIDEIIPLPLLLESLYTKTIIETAKNDIFVYFSETDAFFTLYSEGRFLYTKELTSRLENLYDDYCELCGDRIEYEDFITLLTGSGLTTEDENVKSSLIQLLTKHLSSLNEILSFSKRTFELKSIDRLYIGTSQGIIKGVDELSQTLLSLETLHFNFDYSLNSGTKYSDQIHQLLLLTASIDKDERHTCNLSLFPAPPALKDRPSGRLVLIAAASLVLSLLMPAFYLAYSTFVEFTISDLKIEQVQIHKQKLEREKKINALLAKRKSLEAKKKEALSVQKAQKNVLNKIYLKKVKYPMKAQIIAELTKDLNKHNVQLLQIDYLFAPTAEHHTFTLKMSASKEKNITTMIEKLTAENLKNYTTTIQEIVYSDALDLYLCDLKVELKLEKFNLEAKAKL